jgi:hypothetical protein
MAVSPQPSCGGSALTRQRLAPRGQRAHRRSSVDHKRRLPGFVIEAVAVGAGLVAGAGGYEHQCADHRRANVGEAQSSRAQRIRHRGDGEHHLGARVTASSH